MKGVDIVVGGSVGHMSAFMAQAGTLVVCGDAGRGAGRLYEARIYVRGKVASLGADCVEKKMDDAAHAALADIARSAPGSTPTRQRLPPLRLGARALQLPRSTTRSELLRGEHRAHDRSTTRLRRGSAYLPDHVIAEIRRAAATGIYDIRGAGAKRARAPFRRPGVPRRVDVALSAGRLPREAARPT